MRNVPEHFHKAESLTLYVDGSCRHHPPYGISIGILIEDERGCPVYSLGEVFPYGDSYDAEFRALYEGVRIAYKFRPSSIQICSDHMVLVQMINGGVGRSKFRHFANKSRKWRALWMRCSLLQVTARFIPSKKNPAHFIAEAHLRPGHARRKAIAKRRRDFFAKTRETEG